MDHYTPRYTAGGGGTSSIAEPIEVEGATAEGDAPATNPLDLAAVVQNADPGPFIDGILRRLRLDDQGRLIVTDPSSSPAIQGIDADADPATANPVLVGGKFIDDYEAVPLTDGDAGYALLNALRMLIVQSRSYDPVTDADKVVPVVQSFDNNEPFDFSQAVATDALVSHYFSADTFPYWSLILSTATAGATISVKIYASNETTQPNLSLRNHVEITSDLYGGVINLTSAADLALAVDTPLLYDSYCISFDSDIAATWTAQGKKGAI